MPRTLPTPILPLAAFGLSSFLGCGSQVSEPPVPPRHMVLLTVDTLRADHLGAYGYPRKTSPNLDRLAASGLLFERAIAQWPKTGVSFASLFTGQYPQTTGLTHNAATEIPDGYLTLPELLKAHGFTTLAVVSNPVLAARLGWQDGFDEYLETWDDESYSEDPEEYRRLLWAGRVHELAEPLIERHAEAERLFVWLHYSDPHAPYVLPEGWENPFSGDPHDTGEDTVDLTGTRGRAIGGHDRVSYYVAQYDANIRVTDHFLEEALGQLRGLGILDDALVVFTADHGESLGEHDLHFEHGPLPYNDGVHVPLVFAGRGVPEGRRATPPVELVDLYPTLRDLLLPGAEVAGLEGRSLVPFLGPRPSEAAQAFRYAFSQAGGQWPLRHFRTVQDARWKLVYHPRLNGKSPKPPTYELYDLEADPGETRNLAQTDEAELRRLRGVLFEWMNGTEWLRRPQASIEEQSEETRKALRALGYL